MYRERGLVVNLTGKSSGIRKNLSVISSKKYWFCLLLTLHAKTPKGTSVHSGNTLKRWAWFLRQTRKDQRFVQVNVAALKKTS
ncbi:hypothetical protein ABO04_11585 [Nitrosomonas sp. HPC101]|nr:hypothetical protein [Nitrosomonas sp. HPC101]